MNNTEQKPNQPKIKLKKKLLAFQFNLLTPPTEQEIKMLEERDNTILYSVTLVSFGALVFLVLNLFQLALIKPNLDRANDALATLQKQAKTYDRVKSKNGELYYKSLALEPLLDKDISILSLLDIADGISQVSPDIRILDYKREPSGTFTISIRTSSIDLIQSIVQKLGSNNSVDAIYLKSVSYTNSVQEDPTKYYRFNISFNIITPENE